MSSNFKQYSQYYDLLYRDKDYQAEADYVYNLIQEFRKESHSILELGSGTGIHSRLLAEKKMKVFGLERSEDMVAIAKAMQTKDVDFKVADITDFQLENTFDIAISLFHVISYLTDNEDLIKTFNNVNRHLNTNGIFIFDVWHGPAVHFQQPENRTKVLEDNNIRVTRHAKPVSLPEQNTVTVHYDIAVEDLKTQEIVSFSETHPMRYFSKPEIELLAFATGFTVIHTEEFLTKASPSNRTWGVCYILKKVK